MEKYDAILKAINDKLADYERTVEYYREEMPKKDEIIRELETKNGDLELAFCDATSTNNELLSENESLKEKIENLMTKIAGLKKANESLKAEINKLSEF